ncbi:Hypothetical predicted protein [Olea europaea subsp. europaea]|uniref:Uncharacterized protein n=1 Tax=Olea europaea subsp. europaea TaxID=158383 RepID=A0A8S0RNI2_OLEEU|nr:Hypothetical predicted protein [Olea europaea subsp. europaea]
MSLKVNGPMDCIAELFDEQKDELAAQEKLKWQLVEAEAELEARKKPLEDAGPTFIGEGLVIDEWV